MTEECDQSNHDRNTKMLSRAVIVALVTIIFVGIILREFSIARCDTPFWRGFGIALGACR